MDVLFQVFDVALHRENLKSNPFAVEIQTANQGNIERCTHNSGNYNENRRTVVSSYSLKIGGECRSNGNC